jgi:hypothetical protein
MIRALARPRSAVRDSEGRYDAGEESGGRDAVDNRPRRLASLWHIGAAGGPELLETHERVLIGFVRDVARGDSPIQPVCRGRRRNDM